MIVLPRMTEIERAVKNVCDIAEAGQNEKDQGTTIGGHSLPTTIPCSWFTVRRLIRPVRFHHKSQLRWSIYLSTFSTEILHVGTYFVRPSLSVHPCSNAKVLFM
jgi:hypothetical protein